MSVSENGGHGDATGMARAGWVAGNRGDNGLRQTAGEIIALKRVRQAALGRAEV